MYVKVMAAVIACILMSGETHSTSATIPATENQSWFKKTLIPQHYYKIFFLST